MADRIIDSATQVPEISEQMEALLYDTVVEAQDFMAKDGMVPPFTQIIVGENLYLETYEGDTDECYEAAEKTVKGATNVSMYSFCYDGYVEVEGENGPETLDAVIVELGEVAGGDAYAFANTYTIEDDTLVFAGEDELLYLDTCPNFLVGSASMRNNLAAVEPEEEEAENEAETEAE